MESPDPRIENGSSWSEAVPTMYPMSPPIEGLLDRFWEPGPEFDEVLVKIEPAATPLELLRKMGSSPFERSEFPLIGFLASTYEKVSRYALDRKIAAPKPLDD